MVECGGGLAAAGSEILAVDEQNVRPAVAVEIEEGAARPERPAL